MTKERGFTLIELMIVVVVIGVLASIAVPNFISMQTRAKEAGVKSNSHAVQVAAEDFCVQNNGVYATNLAAATPGGETIIDILPLNQHLQNPFTHALTEPVDGPATNLGETGYESVVNWSGIAVGYIVTGQGRARTVCRLSNGN